jgi:AraC-like DNA-binding protein
VGSGSSWDTGTIAVIDREEAVRAALGDTHLPWDIRVPDAAGYRGALAWDELGDATIVECRSEPLAGRRGPAEMRRTDREMLAILLVVAGRERVRQDDVCAELTAGDALLWSSHSPIDFEVVERLHKVTLLVPAARLAALRPRSRPGPVALPAANPAVRLLAGHLQTLTKVVSELPRLDGLFAIDLTLDLLVRAIDPAPLVTTEEGPGKRALLDRAMAIISNELADPELTPARLAARLSISPRYLHLLFTTTGETVAAHIRGRRLERVRHDLADGRHDADSVTDIAFRWGFSDSGHLSRTFRAEHDMSPTQFRDRARARRR